MSTYCELPRNLEIEGVMHVQHWRSKTLAIYQNYDSNRTVYDGTAAKQVVPMGLSRFHLFRVEQLNPGEARGQKIGTYSNLQEAMNAAEKQGQFA